MTIQVEENTNQLVYNLHIQIHPAEHQINGKVHIYYPPGPRFYLNQALEVRSITAHGRSLSFRRLPDESDPYIGGSAVVIDGEYQNELVIEYAGTLEEKINNINMVQADLIELASYTAWFPMFTNLPHFEFELTVDLPASYLAICNGRQDLQDEIDDRNISKWTSWDLCYDILMVASPHLHKVDKAQSDTPIEVFFSKASSTYMTSKQDSLAKAVQRLYEYYGPPPTRGMLRYIHSPRDGWGYVRLPLFVVSEEYMLSQLAQPFGEARDFHGTVHELAHLWWIIAAFGTPDDWLNEGMAEYSAYRLSEEFFGAEFAEILVQEYCEHAAQSQSDTPIIETTNASADRYINHYEKPTLIYLEARRRYGQEALDRVFRALLKRFASKRDATTELFLKEVNQQIGPEAEQFFKAALHRKKWSDIQEGHFLREL